MANIFNSIPLVAPKRNKFKLGFNNKFTCEMGQLIPIYVQDVLPSDRFKLSMGNLIRFAPLLAPIMSEVDVYFHFFFIPSRLLWSDWEAFVTGSDKGFKLPDDKVPQSPRLIFSGDVLNQATNPRVSNQPFSGALRHGSLLDYLGFQTFSEAVVGGTQYPIDALPLRAYFKVVDDYYRDENLTTSMFEYAPEAMDFSGDHILSSDDPAAFSMQFHLANVCWKKDYFTSALPWAQKGDDVLIPGSSSISLSGSGTVPVSGIISAITGHPGFSNNYGSGPITMTTTSTSDTSSLMLDGSPTKLQRFEIPHKYANGTETNNLSVDVNSIASNLQLDSVASEGTIRELRRAFAAQKFLERRAVGGTRYIEQNLAFFGVKSSDARLQRAEFLGGYKTPLVVSQVLQTSESTNSSPLGQTAGQAISSNGKFIFDREFEEYGYIMGFMFVRPKADYIQGIPRMYLRRDILDYYFPQFAKIGEQPIYNQELFFNAKGSELTNYGTFGYAPRYSEYRFRNNTVHGDFKESLKFWTLARDFNLPPQLSEEFMLCNPSNRIFAVEDSDFSHLWCEVAFNVSALRPIPKFAESL